MELFTQRFLPRLDSMARDVDSQTAGAAIDTLTALLKENVLSEDNGAVRAAGFFGASFGHGTLTGADVDSRSACMNGLCVVLGLSE